MSDDLIRRAAELMREQAAAYARLEAATAQLGAALVGSTPEQIESLTRAGEVELLKMRARLVQVMAALGAFADARAQAATRPPVGREAREAFEAASNNLMQAARQFERTRRRAAALANSGASFASACIEVCGVPPTTYRAPYARRGESNVWA
jgi:hypothetical protein